MSDMTILVAFICGFMFCVICIIGLYRFGMSMQNKPDYKIEDNDHEQGKY